VKIGETVMRDISSRTSRPVPQASVFTSLERELPAV
jgi:hypothetical protein